jgi:hypothetical protein
LSELEQSRKSTKPLPLEVIENVQEAIWGGDHRIGEGRAAPARGPGSSR